MAASTRAVLSPQQILAGCRRVHAAYHSPEFIRTDPIRWPRAFVLAQDREFAGLVAAAFAIGRVQQIDAFLETLFARLPGQHFAELRESDVEELLQGLYYRFFTNKDIVAFVAAAAWLLRSHGSFQALVAPALRQQGSLGDGLAALCQGLRSASKHPLPGILLPNTDGPAKRLRLFARWMVRHDDVDLGLWDSVSPALLEYPLDTHLFRVMSHLGIARSATPGKAALEQINSFFWQHSPEDPVAWDFCLTRIGIGAGLGSEEYRQSIDSFFVVE